MSVTSSSATSATTPQGTLGDVPPITFPGVVSGIDYDAIIQKYTAATQAAEVPYLNEANNLTAANTEILKIQNLLGAVQDALTALSTPATFQAFTTTPSVAGLVTATTIGGQKAIPGTYTIAHQTAATSTAVTNDGSANATLTPAQYAGTPLVAIGTSITPTNGKSANGQAAPNGCLTINGVKINYDVTVDSLQAILSRINGAGAGASATYDAATGRVTLASTTPAALALGSAADSGNLLAVLHVDTAQDVTPAAGTVVGATGAGAPTIAVSSSAGYAVGAWLRLDAGQPTQEDVQIAAIAGGAITLASATTQNHADGSGVTPAEYVTGSAPVVGINQFATLTGTGNAGFATAVTSGTFTIDGTQLTVNAATQSVNDVLTAIDQSGAGVTATFDTATGRIVLTSTTPGSRSIVLGSGSDTSNFLNAVGLTTGSVTIGTQASLTYQGPSGGLRTVYSQTNDFTSVIPGIDLKLTSSTATPYTIDVANDPTAAEKVIGTFVTAYNAAIDELNRATAPPAVATGRSSATGQQVSVEASAGGALYKKFEIANLRDTLVQLVSGFIPSGSASYNSLQSIGLELDTNSISSGAIDADDATAKVSDANSTQNLTSTSGKLQSLDVSKFEAALTASPSAVEALFTSTTGGLAQAMGALLTNATGLPTFLARGLASSIPSTALLDAVEDSNSLQIDSLRRQISLIDGEAISQANELRAEFSASETQIAALQALQSQIASIGH